MPSPLTLNRRRDAGIHQVTTDLPPLLPARRPTLVWIISLFYFFGTAALPFCYAIIYTGWFPFSDAQKAQLATQTAFDHSMTVLIVVLNLIGAIQLFRLKKTAFPFFLSTFLLGLVVTAIRSSRGTGSARWGSQAWSGRFSAIPLPLRSSFTRRCWCRRAC